MVLIPLKRLRDTDIRQIPTYNVIETTYSLLGAMRKRSKINKDQKKHLHLLHGRFTHTVGLASQSTLAIVTSEL